MTLTYNAVIDAIASGDRGAYTMDDWIETDEYGRIESVAYLRRASLLHRLRGHTVEYCVVAPGVADHASVWAYCPRRVPDIYRTEWIRYDESSIRLMVSRCGLASTSPIRQRPVADA